MKVIVFGGSGFLGSHVADELSSRGHDVTIFDIRTSPYLQANQKMICGDVLDQTVVEDAVKGNDIVYNFAGIADLEEASQRPLESVKFNILGNTIILEACRTHKVKRFVFASTLYVYSQFGSFYRSTKQACETIIENYYEVYGMEYTILRYGSLYGLRGDNKNFIYNIIKQAITEQKITRPGDGEEIREYIHVKDAAAGSVNVLSDKYINEYVILTGVQQMKIKDLLLMIKEMFNNKIQIEFISPTKNDFHYEITPYTFIPKVAKKLVSHEYLDLGQGILEIINYLYNKENQTSVYDGIYLDK